MADLNKILQDFVNNDYDTLVNIAKTAMKDLLPTLNEATDGEGSSVIIALFATSLAVDGNLTDLEYKFVCDVLGTYYTYDQVKSLAQAHYNEKIIASVDGIVDSCSTELKSKLLTLCCAFLAVDETISVDEVKFIKKLLT